MTNLNGNQQQKKKQKQKQKKKGWNLRGKIWPNSTTEDNIHQVSLTWSVLPQENGIEKIKNFHRAIQSNDMVFAGFNHIKFWQGFFINLY